ncbi:MAG: PRC-barrel domain-containing protein [Patescibacteria group bacterium]
MQTRCQKLQGIPVKTRSGKLLGKLVDVSIETDTGRLDAILVRSRGFIPGLLEGELRISWAQVVSLSTEEAIVVDNVVPAGGRRLAFGLDRKSA